MPPNLNRTMQEAMQLMQSGDLQAATRAIQRGLHAEAATPGAEASAARTDFIEGSCRVVDERAADPAQAPAGETRGEPPQPRRDGEFRDHRFEGEAGVMHYKLFIPAGLGEAVPPLIVMLHGCTQSPDDFARGTRMNALAQEQGYVVAYPAQSQSRNAGKCWNWFRTGDQQRGQGEPALLAALTAHLVGKYRLDDRRVYVAGLSAGGAMAAVLASTYPDLYAAIGVHSGLPFGAAHDLPSALAAMKQGAAAPSSRAAAARIGTVPAIVFHGDRDTTVDSCNGTGVIAQSIGATPQDCGLPEAHATVERGSTPDGRAYTRTIHKDDAGTVIAEQWLVHGAGHAWFGGDPSGSYTDPAGPDASEHMLRFFSERARGAIN